MSQQARPLHAGTRLWHVNLDEATAALLDIEARVPRLSLDERRRQGTVKDLQAARRWAAAHIALRLVLEHEAGPAIRREGYATSATGKPELRGHGIAFSLSHTGGLALIATGPAEPLGVDVETARPLRMSQDRRQAIEAGAERLGAQPLPRGETARFLQAWVRVEAVAKAQGLGLATVLAMTGAYGPRRGSFNAAALDALRAEMALVDLALGPGVFAAVAMPAGTTGAAVTRLPSDVDGLQAFALCR